MAWLIRLLVYSSVEGWYPLLDGPHFTGELKLKVRTTSTVVFPLSYYSHLLSVRHQVPVVIFVP